MPHRSDLESPHLVPLLLLLILATTAGLVVAAAVARLGPRVPPARALGAVAIAGGTLFGVLTLLVSSSDHPSAVDRSTARWAHEHSSAFSRNALDAITRLGSIETIAVFCVVLALYMVRRRRALWAVPFLGAVVAGEEVLSLSFKALVSRPRPTLSSAASSLGPAFPSGHSTNAAAFYAAAALVLSQALGPRARAGLFGAAAFIAVAVAGSRVLLDLHWLTDVIGGLALGWTWFAVCALVFGAWRRGGREVS